MNSASVAVVGAGLAGIACARRLAGAGVQVRVFESQRAAGGRLATRRFEAASFDHGAQYVTVTDLGFRQIVEDAHGAGAAGLWQPDWPDRRREDGELWVGTPGMTALPRYLARGLDIEYGARIVRLERHRRGWALLDDRGSAHVDFGLVVLAMPAPLAAVLAGPHTTLAARVRSIPMAPCWAVMVAFEEPLAGVPDAGFADDPILPGSPATDRSRGVIRRSPGCCTRGPNGRGSNSSGRPGRCRKPCSGAFPSASGGRCPGRDCPTAIAGVMRASRRRSVRLSCSTAMRASVSAVTGVSTRGSRPHFCPEIPSARRSRNHSAPARSGKMHGSR